MFETTEAYQQRLSEQEAVERQVRAIVSALNIDFHDRMDGLKSRIFPIENYKVELVHYDADAGQLRVVLGKRAFTFDIEPAAAQRIYQHAASLKVEGAVLGAREEFSAYNLPDQIILIDPVSAERWVSWASPNTRD
jgi:hypothetical protein